MRIAATTFALLALAAPLAVAAAEGLQIGALELRSTLDQPFEATLTVDASSASALDSLDVRLANATSYSQRQLERDAVLDQLRFQVVARDGRRATVRISSSVALREPTLSLLVEARTANARALREYTVLLDPPRAARGPPAAAAPTVASGGEGGTESAQAPAVELVWELDAYYTSIGFEIPLTDSPVPDGGKMSEWEVYKTLFKDSLHPRLLLLEASVYPMPVLGTYVKEHSPDTYDKFTLGDTDLNLLEGLTAGFQEPWAISAFIGSGMNFTREGKRAKGTNKGYMGYLVSYGAKHIRQNVLIDDDWWEFEWKLKGERAFEDEDLTWSFRVGLKSHGNPDVADTLYFGGRRSNLDYNVSWLGWLENSSFEWMTELDQTGLGFLRQELVFGKRFPMKGKRWAFALDIGMIYEKDAKYTGVLYDPTADNVTIVFRPNIVF